MDAVVSEQILRVEVRPWDEVAAFGLETLGVESDPTVGVEPADQRDPHLAVNTVELT